MLLYNIGIFLYGFALKVASLFNGKARLWVRGRRGLLRRLEQEVPEGSRVMWVHCASLGEFEQGRPLIEAVKAQHPEFRVMLTFFSPSGYEIRKNYALADWVFYLPLDTPRNARRFMRTLRPEIAVFVKYEFWLNYLRQLKRSGCRTFVVSAIFRRGSVFFKWYGGMFRRALSSFEKIFVQNDDSKQLLAGLGVADAVVAGDTRFDRVARIAENAQDLPVIARFAQGAKVFVAGSTWPPDEDLVMQAVAAFPGVKFIVAPHEMDQDRIDRFVAASPRKAVRYTESGEDEVAEADVLVVDTIGILSSVYRYGTFGYIGGGFGVGIHNTLEAAAFGLPLAFGPNYAKFREARDLIGIGAARSISSFPELQQWLDGLLADPERYGKESAEASGYVEGHKGATDIIMETLFG